MQKTYSELFNLQNLLEKTVRNVAVSNNLKFAGSTDLASTATSTGKDAKVTGVSGGRPYYPGSPVKVRTIDSTGHLGAAPANKEAKKVKKDAPPDVQPQQKSNGGRMSPFQTLARKEFKYPGQQQLSAEMQNLERLQRMTELWGSPDGAGGSFLRSPSPHNKSSDSQVTSGRKGVGSRDIMHGNKKDQAASNRLQPSPRTPSASSASFIPRLTSPPAATQVLNAAHATASSTPSKASVSLKTSKGTAGVSGNPASSHAGFKGLQSKREDLVNSDLLQSPSKFDARLSHAVGPLASKDAPSINRTGEIEHSRELSPRRRSSEGLLSSEEQELQVT